MLSSFKFLNHKKIKNILLSKKKPLIIFHLTPLTIVLFYKFQSVWFIVFLGSVIYVGFIVVNFIEFVKKISFDLKQNNKLATDNNVKRYILVFLTIIALIFKQ